MSFLKKALKDYSNKTEPNKDPSKSIDVSILEDRGTTELDHKVLDLDKMAKGDKQSRKKYLESIRRAILIGSPQYSVFINKQFRYIKNDRLKVKFTGKNFYVGDAFFTLSSSYAIYLIYREIVLTILGSKTYESDVRNSTVPDILKSKLILQNNIASEYIANNILIRYSSAYNLNRNLFGNIVGAVEKNEIVPPHPDSPHWTKTKIDNVFSQITNNTYNEFKDSGEEGIKYFINIIESDIYQGRRALLEIDVSDNLQGDNEGPEEGEGEQIAPENLDSDNGPGEGHEDDEDKNEESNDNKSKKSESSQKSKLDWDDDDKADNGTGDSESSLGDSSNTENNGEENEDEDYSDTEGQDKGNDTDNSSEAKDSKEEKLNSELDLEDYTNDVDISTAKVGEKEFESVEIDLGEADTFDNNDLLGTLEELVEASKNYGVGLPPTVEERRVESFFAEYKWYEALRSWVTTFKPYKQYNYMRPNKKTAYAVTPLPSQSGRGKTSDVQELFVYLDVSSSVVPEEVDLAISIVKSASKHFPKGAKFFTFSTVVKEIKLSKSHKTKDLIEIGGGTDIGRVMMHIEEKKGFKNKLYIIITDGLFNWDNIAAMKPKSAKTAVVISDTNFSRHKNRTHAMEEEMKNKGVKNLKVILTGKTSKDVEIKRR